MKEIFLNTSLHRHTVNGKVLVTKKSFLINCVIQKHYVLKILIVFAFKQNTLEKLFLYWMI